MEEGRFQNQGWRFSDLNSTFAFMVRAGLLLLFVTLVLRAETFFHPLILPTDEGLYFRIAYQWLVEHTPLYLGAFDHKPPGIYYLYGLLMTLGGPSMLSIRVGTVVFAWAGALLCYGFARRLAVARPHAAGIGAGLAYAILSCRLTGLNANLEIFFSPLIIALLWAVYEASARKDLRLLALSGLLAGIVFVIKYTCGVEAVALPILWWAWQSASSFKGIFSRQILVGILLFGLAFLAPVALTCLHLTLDGPGVAALLERTILRNLTHKEGARSLYKPLAYLYFGGRVAAEYALGWLALIGFVAKWDHWGGPKVSLLLGWLAAALVSATFTGHLFDHYVIECLAPLCIMAGLWVDKLGRSFPTSPSWATMALLAMVFIPLGADEARRQWPNIAADVAAARRGGHIWAGDSNYRLASYLKQQLKPGQYFFAVEGSPTLYLLAGHDLPSDYTYWSFLSSPHFAKVVGLDQAAEINRILALPPRFIVAKERDIAGLGSPGTFVPANAARIQQAVDEHYTLQDTVAGWWVWQRKD